MKIRTKLVLTFTVAVLAPVVILSLYSIKEVSDNAIEQFQKSSAKEINQVDKAFDLFFTETKRNIDYLASLPEIRNPQDGPKFLTQENVNGFSGWANISPSSGQLWASFDRFAKTHSNLAYIYTGREDGTYIEWPGTIFKAPFDPRVRPWYIKAKQANGETIMTNAYYWKGDDATYLAVAKALKNDQNQFSGVVSLDVSVNQLTQIVKNITIGDQGFIVLLEDNNNILVDPLEPENTFKSIDSVNTPFYKLISANPDDLFTVKRKDTTYLGQIITSKYLGWKFVALVPESEVYAAATKQSYVTLAIAIPLVVIFIAMAMYVARIITSQISNVAEVLRQISRGHGDLTVQLDVSSNDEVAELSQAFNDFVQKLNSLIGEVVNLSSQLKGMADQAADKAQQWRANSGTQLEKVTLVTEAISEMSKATAEIASSSEQAAGVAEHGARSCSEGKNIVESTRKSIEILSNEVTTTNQIIGKLNSNTQQITTILTTIQGIAEQTNLLALNAAIEAARAGDHGRGFAVVADEVRNLSQKTTASTAEIQQMIQELQNTTQQATSVMENSKNMTHDAVEHASLASESLMQLASAIEEIKGTSMQIATATEEQSFVCGDITQNTQQINDIANQLTEDSKGQLRTAEEFRALAINMHGLVSQFKL